MQLLISPKFQKQWRAILDFFVKRNGTTSYSRKLDDELKRLLKQIKNDPEPGEKTTRRGVRRRIFENYAVFYRVRRTNIEIVSVIDMRRNIPLR